MFGLAAWPCCRLLTNKLLLRLFPRIYAFLTSLLLFWIVGILLLAVYFPKGVHALAILTGIALAVTAWRARSGYGLSRGFPPGSLSIVNSIEAIVDRRFYHSAARWPVQSSMHPFLMLLKRFAEPFRQWRRIARSRRITREYLYRLIENDVEFEGFLFPQGWLVRLCVWESHRSAEMFTDPEKFDPDRFLESKFNKLEYSPFGHSQHVCNGIHLNGMVCGTFIEELARGFDWTVIHDGRVERDFRHWHHWRPDSAFRLRLISRRP